MLPKEGEIRWQTMNTFKLLHTTLILEKSYTDGLGVLMDSRRCCHSLTFGLAIPYIWWSRLFLSTTPSSVGRLLIRVSTYTWYDGQKLVPVLRGQYTQVIVTQDMLDHGFTSRQFITMFFCMSTGLTQQLRSLEH